MARIRTVKPELWTDPEFVECSSNARLLFLAALNFASDFGVMADKPMQLKMQCFPADALDVAPLVDELVDHGFWLRRTAPDGAKVLVIRTFCSHQKVDKPNPGRWGNPSEWAQFDEPSTNAPRAVGESSTTEGNGREVSFARIPRSSTPRKPQPPAAEFETFWNAYPKKKARGSAQKAYVRARLETDAETILSGIKAITAEYRDPTRRQFIPYPASYLNQARWLDETPAASNGQRIVNGARLEPGVG